MSDWFRIIWDDLTDEERKPLRFKARWEQRSLRAVIEEWPTLVPERHRTLIPPPERDAA